MIRVARFTGRVASARSSLRAASVVGHTAGEGVGRHRVGPNVSSGDLRKLPGMLFQWSTYSEYLSVQSTRSEWGRPGKTRPTPFARVRGGSLAAPQEEPGQSQERDSCTRDQQTAFLDQAVDHEISPIGQHNETNHRDCNEPAKRQYPTDRGNGVPTGCAGSLIAALVRHGGIHLPIGFFSRVVRPGLVRERRASTLLPHQSPWRRQHPSSQWSCGRQPNQTCRYRTEAQRKVP